MAIHSCTVCGLTEDWNDSWMWFGSYRDAEDGGPILLICSEKCKQEAEDAGITRLKPVPRIDKRMLEIKREARLADKEARERAEWKRLSAKYG